MKNNTQYIRMKRVLNNLILATMAAIVLVGCQENQDYHDVITDGSYQTAAQIRLTNVIIHDIFSPPVASRIYAYPSIAAYEVAVMADPQYKSLMGQLNDFEKKEFDAPEDVYYPLASLAAYYKVATALIFSEDMMTSHRDKAYKEIREKGVPKRVFDLSVAFGEEVADHIIAYSKKDTYHQSRSFEKYTVKNDPNTWQPTPPAYMEGIEPHWNKIRPFVLDSAAQFKSVPPTEFSSDPNSVFFKEAEEVFKVVKDITKEQKDIAYFWDCNPYKVNIKGHVMFAEKKSLQVDIGWG